MLVGKGNTTFLPPLRYLSRWVGRIWSGLLPSYFQGVLIKNCLEEQNYHKCYKSKPGVCRQNNFMRRFISETVVLLHDTLIYSPSLKVTS